MVVSKLTFGWVALALVCQTTGLGQQTRSYEPRPVDQQLAPLGAPNGSEAGVWNSDATDKYSRKPANVLVTNGGNWLAVPRSALLFEFTCPFGSYNHRQWIQLRVWSRKRLVDTRQQQLAAKRVQNEADRLAKYEVAYRLTDDEIDRRTGAIRWPIVLQTVEYAELRSRIEELFRKLVYSRGNAATIEKQIAATTERLRSELHRNVASIERADYIAAQKFLCGLKYEPEFTTPVNILTSTSTGERPMEGFN